MKKLMVIAAVLAASVASAATIDWKVSVDTADRAKKFMFFNYDDQAAVLGILDAGGASTYSQLQALAYSSGGTTYQFATTAKSSSKSDFLSDISKGDTMFLVLFDTTAAATVTDGMAYKDTGEINGTAYIYDGNADPPEASPGTFNIAASSFASSGVVGSGAGVPEPTSGLLMLLGVAGLALRRRHA